MMASVVALDECDITEDFILEKTKELSDAYDKKNGSGVVTEAHPLTLIYRRLLEEKANFNAIL